MLLPSLNHLQVTIMEARNFISAREMLNEGNWILTTMNSEPRYEKPPLPTWITAFMGLVFGIKNVFALRFPGIVMVWIIGVYTYLFSNKMLNNKQHSFINSLIVVTSFYVIGIIIEAPWDIYTHAFMLIAIYHLYLAYIGNKNKNIVISVLFIACSVLSKGPISVYALLLPFLIAYPIVYGIRNRFIWKTILILIPGILLGSIWFFYVRIADPEAFLKIASVETSNWSSYQVKPFYYYWSFFIQSGIWTIPAFIGLLYPYLKSRVSNLKAYRLSLFWTLFAVILLSLIPEKKSRYLMPVLIPLAVNTGFYIQYLITNFTKLKDKKETIPVYFNFGLLALIAVLFPLVIYLFVPEQFNQNLLFILLLSAILFVIGGTIFYYLYTKQMLQVFYFTVLFFVAILLAVVPVNPDFAIQNENYNSISGLKTKADKENIKVYVLDIITPEMLWNYGGIIPMVEEKDSLYILPIDRKFGLLINDKNFIEEGNYNENYMITKKETFDLNKGKINTRKHKPRYVNHYYIFETKK
jgi:4-amino-4-deoxy-L-arabinose transferase-like glycosyltransferase